MLREAERRNTNAEMKLLSGKVFNPTAPCKHKSCCPPVMCRIRRGLMDDTHLGLRLLILPWFSVGKSSPNRFCVFVSNRIYVQK